MSDPLLRFCCEEHGWFVHQSLNQVFFLFKCMWCVYHTWAVGLMKYGPYSVISLLCPCGYLHLMEWSGGHGPHCSMMSCEVNIGLMTMNYILVWWQPVEVSVILVGFGIILALQRCSTGLLCVLVLHWIHHCQMALILHLYDGCYTDAKNFG